MGVFVGSQASDDDNVLSEPSGSAWDVVDWFAQTIGVGSLHWGGVPNAIGSCGQESQTIVGGKCFGVGIPSNAKHHFPTTNC